MSDSTDTITSTLRRVRDGESDAQAELMQLIHAKLHKMARRQMSHQNKGHTLGASGLVQETFLKLFGKTPMDWVDRAHFFRTAAQAMRHILVDHARKKKRQGEALDEYALNKILEAYQKKSHDLILLDEALETLAATDPQAAQLLELRFFAGLKISDIAKATRLPQRTVERAIRWARAFLRKQMRR